MARLGRDVEQRRSVRLTSLTPGQTATGRALDDGRKMVQGNEADRHTPRARKSSSEKVKPKSPCDKNRSTHQKIQCFAMSRFSLVPFPFTKAAKKGITLRSGSTLALLMRGIGVAGRLRNGIEQ